MSDDLEELESRLREAHSFEARPGLQAEIRARLRPARPVPWPAFSAAAAVLIAAVGVGFLLSHGPHGGGATATSQRAQALLPPFGRLPRPPANERGGFSTAAGAAAQAPSPSGAPLSVSQQEQPVPSVPTAALVLRWKLPAQPATKPCAAPPYPVASGAFPCGQAMQEALYRLSPPPAGARLVGVVVSGGDYGYLEPAYQLPDGSIVTALTQDELQG